MTIKFAYVVERHIFCFDCKPKGSDAWPLYALPAVLGAIIGDTEGNIRCDGCNYIIGTLEDSWGILR